MEKRQYILSRQSNAFSHVAPKYNSNSKKKRKMERKKENETQLLNRKYIYEIKTYSYIPTVIDRTNNIEQGLKK